MRVAPACLEHWSAPPAPCGRPGGHAGGSSCRSSANRAKPPRCRCGARSAHQPLQRAQPPGPAPGWPSRRVLHDTALAGLDGQLTASAPSAPAAAHRLPGRGDRSRWIRELDVPSARPPAIAVSGSHGPRRRGVASTWVLPGWPASSSANASPGAQQLGDPLRRARTC